MSRALPPQKRQLTGYFPSESIPAATIYYGEQAIGEPLSYDTALSYWLVERVCVGMIGGPQTGLEVSAKTWGSLGTPPFQINMMKVMFCPDGNYQGPGTSNPVPPQVTAAAEENQGSTCVVSFFPRLLVQNTDAIVLQVFGRNDTAGTVVIQPSWFVQYTAYSSFGVASREV